MDAWMVVAAAVAIGSILKAVTGLGLPLVAIPVMAAIVGSQRAVVAMAIPGVVTNAWLAWHHRAARDELPRLRALLVTGVAGAAVGGWMVTWVEERWLGACLAVVVAVYVVVRVRWPQASLSRSVRWLSPVVGGAGGLLQGATGISGPLLAVFLHAQRLRPEAFVHGLAMLFTVFGLGQVATLAALGAFDRTAVGDTIAALVPAAVVFPLGLAIGRRVTPAWFDRLVLVLLVALAGTLARSAVVG